MTLAVDFDGPVHDYTHWGDGGIHGGETPGAFRALRYMMERDAVFILTSRPPAPVAQWLRDRGGFATLVDEPGSGREFWDVRGVLLVTRRKYPALTYIDDRAVLYTGDWNDTLAAACAFAPGLRPRVPPQES